MTLCSGQNAQRGWQEEGNGAQAVTRKQAANSSNAGYRGIQHQWEGGGESAGEVGVPTAVHGEGGEGGGQGLRFVCPPTSPLSRSPTLEGVTLCSEKKEEKASLQQQTQLSIHVTPSRLFQSVPGVVGIGSNRWEIQR